MAREIDSGIGEALKQAREERGLSKAELGRQLGISGAAISQWESGGPGPSVPRLLEALDKLHVNFWDEPFRYFIETRLGQTVNIGEIQSPQFISRLLDASEDESTNRKFATDVKSAPVAPKYEEIQGLSRDIPVMGNAVAGEDADFWLNGTETDRAIRPPGLANARGIFALYTVNDSMYPAWREGALFYVNPHRAPAIGDDVVVEVISGPDSEPKPAFLKRLKARRSGKIIVEQFNPPKEIEFDRNEVRLYRVIPWEEALGLS